MKALSIRQPWAWAILHAGKRVENRDWQHVPRAMIGETFLLHAAKGCTQDEYFEAARSMRFGPLSGDGRYPGELIPRELPELHQLTRGAIVGRAKLVRYDHSNASPWAVPGALHLILADVSRLTSPIPFKGALGFFEVPDGLLSGATWEPAGGR